MQRNGGQAWATGFGTESSEKQVRIEKWLLYFSEGRTFTYDIRSNIRFLRISFMMNGRRRRTRDFQAKISENLKQVCLFCAPRRAYAGRAGYTLDLSRPGHVCKTEARPAQWP